MSDGRNLITSPRAAADTTSRLLWERFIHPGNEMFYDYWWGRLEFPYLPTADEIARNFPNAAG